METKTKTSRMLKVAAQKLGLILMSPLLVPYRWFTGPKLTPEQWSTVQTAHLKSMGAAFLLSYFLAASFLLAGVLKLGLLPADSVGLIWSVIGLCSLLIILFDQGRNGTVATVVVLCAFALLEWATHLAYGTGWTTWFLGKLFGYDTTVSVGLLLFWAFGMSIMVAISLAGTELNDSYIMTANSIRRKRESMDENAVAQANLKSLSVAYPDMLERYLFRLGDIVMTDFEGKVTIIKRVYGLPGLRKRVAHLFDEKEVVPTAPAPDGKE